MLKPACPTKRALNMLFAVLLTTFPIWPLAVAHGGSFAACIRESVERDHAGRTEFQHGLFNLIVAGKPEFKALAALNRDLQLALAESRATKFAYLLKNDPARIETKSTLTAFRNFDWTAQDEEALQRDSETYRALSRRTTELRGRSDGHPDWPKMRAFFAEGLAASTAYRDLAATLAENDRAVAAFIETCPLR